MPVIGGTAAAGKRVCWAQYAGAAGATMASVGMAALTVTGGTNAKDTAGYWSTPQSAVGGSCRLSWPNAFTSVDLLPKLVVRLRTPATITNWRFLVSLNESFAGVNTDTPSTTVQRGIYVRYSTSVPDGGWVVQTVAAARSTSATVLAIAASTVYTITVTVNSTTSVTVDINGTSIAVTANIITGVQLGAEILAGDLSGAAATQFDVESVYLESN
jgi:hypothetical protein